MNKKMVKAVLGAAGVLALTACGSGGENSASEGMEDNTGEIQVMTSFYPMYEFTREVAGNRAQVGVMVDPGTDAHGYEPSAQDVAKAIESDVFVYSSDQMEYWVPSLLDSVESDELIAVRTEDGVHDRSEEENHHHDSTERHHSHSSQEESTNEIVIEGITGHYHSGDTAALSASSPYEGEFSWEVQQPSGEFEVVQEGTDTFEQKLTETITVRVTQSGESGEKAASSGEITLFVDDHGTQDPHIWLDPVYAQSQVEVIKNALIEADPEGEEIYTQNAEDFQEQLQVLHEEYEKALDGAENRTFVVQHQAFGYLANRYDLNQVSIGGLSTEVEPSPSRIAEIGEIVNESGVPVVYYQSGGNSSIAQTVAAETDTEVEVLFDLESYTEEMQDENLDYLGAMRHNLEALKKSVN